MKLPDKMKALHKIQEQLFDSFQKNHKRYFGHLPQWLKLEKEKAIQGFQAKGFPNRSMEEWRTTNLEKALQEDYGSYFREAEKDVNIDHVFQCEIHNFGTLLISQLNGFHVSKDGKDLTVMDNGIVIGSILAAAREMPELVKENFGKIMPQTKDGLNDLNTAMFQDGFFLYVPDNVSFDVPIQMVNIINTPENLMIHPRNFIHIGKNSNVKVVYCDDSIQHGYNFINALTEIYVDSGAKYDFYKLQNKDNQSILLNNNYVKQEKDSETHNFTIIFNGGIIRNDINVQLDEYCKADVNGLYLVDRKQKVDNLVYIQHTKPNSLSNQNFKGIVDDEARAYFNGYVRVDKDAQKTNAFQNNRSILLSEDAKVGAKPFLEIYADDVKCSHGATVGQLDENALFYIMSRGISEKNARILLMYAFASEIVEKVSIEKLRGRLDEMVTKRLKGELSSCEQCLLHCSDKHIMNFDIDYDKV
jgi:Fe-S cluster assembly protein SufD